MSEENTCSPLRLSRTSVPLDGPDSTCHMMKVVGAKTFFGSVTVSVRSPSRDGGTTVSDEIMAASPALGEVTSSTAPQWVHAVMAGATQAVEHLRSVGQFPGTPTIAVTKVVGSVADTTVGVLHCAGALLAAWRALMPGTVEPEVACHPKLHLVFPPANRTSAPKARTA
jgi:hypothetical protein